MPGIIIALVALAILAALALLAAIAAVLVMRKERQLSQSRIEQLLQDRSKEIASARQESVQQSRYSLKGKLAEELAPLAKGFPYLPSDARFIGSPIDYVVFNGSTTLREGVETEDEELEVVLLEVKQGDSALTFIQKEISRAMLEGRFRFEVCRISQSGDVRMEAWRPIDFRGPLK